MSPLPRRQTEWNVTSLCEFTNAASGEPCLVKFNRDGSVEDGRFPGTSPVVGCWCAGKCRIPTRPSDLDLVGPLTQPQHELRDRRKRSSLDCTHTWARDRTPEFVKVHLEFGFDFRWKNSYSACFPQSNMLSYIEHIGYINILLLLWQSTVQRLCSPLPFYWAK